MKWIGLAFIVFGALLPGCGRTSRPVVEPPHFIDRVDGMTAGGMRVLPGVDAVFYVGTYRVEADGTILSVQAAKTSGPVELLSARVVEARSPKGALVEGEPGQFCVDHAAFQAGLDVGKPASGVRILAKERIAFVLIMRPSADGTRGEIRGIKVRLRSSDHHVHTVEAFSPTVWVQQIAPAQADSVNSVCITHR